MAQIVVDHHQRAAGSEHSHHLGEAGLAARWEEVGEPSVHHVDGRIGKWDVLGGTLHHRCVCRALLGRMEQSAVGLDADQFSRVGVVAEPVAGAAPQIEEGSSGPRRDRSHRLEHELASVEGVVLDLVQFDLELVGCRHEVGELHGVGP